MAPDSLFLSVCSVMLCWPGAARGAIGDGKCSCEDIPRMPQTIDPPQTCFNRTFRYTCVEGFVRKAGTSNLIKCAKTSDGLGWTKSKLICISDPLRPAKKPPQSTATTIAASTRPQTTQSGSTVASVDPETNSTEPTSPAEQSHHEQGEELTTIQHEQDFAIETQTIRWTTSVSTSREISNNTTVNPSPPSLSEHKLGKTTSLIIFSLMLIFIVVGLCITFYRRRTRNNNLPGTREEKMHMNDI